MYFAQFQSYEQVMATVHTFRIDVTTVTGELVRSSDMPASVMKTVTDYIDLCEETRTAFQVWDYKQKTMTLVPYHSIASVRLIIVASDPA
jgi:hypothetical protein